jgi:hypothetical protein
MIRITTQQEQGCTVVIIDGQVTAEDLPEIERVRSAQSGDVTLKLGGVTSCAAVGVRLLRDWLAAGAQLRDATLFLRMILEDTMPNAGTRIPDNEKVAEEAYVHGDKTR